MIEGFPVVVIPYPKKLLGGGIGRFLPIYDHLTLILEVFMLGSVDLGGFNLKAIGLDDFGDFERFDDPIEVNDPAPEEDVKEADSNRSVSVFKTMNIQKKMRLLSQSALDDVLPWHFEPGAAYHVISAGDVDSLTYLRHVVKQQRCDYVMLSTWCMAIEDANEMLDWLNRGMVKRFDFYVGEIFKDGYRGCRDALDEICRLCGGRVARFRNHSKLMVAYGDKFDCVIESSANVNTNPRTEQTCITVDSDLCDFYKDYFDEINDFDGGYKQWKPWKR